MGIDKLDIDEAKGILDELKAMRNSSVHDSYHNVYSQNVQKELTNLQESYLDLVDKVGISEAKKLMREEFDNYVGELFYKLSSGDIKL